MKNNFRFPIFDLPLHCRRSAPASLRVRFVELMRRWPYFQREARPGFFPVQSFALRPPPIVAMSSSVHPAMELV
jgi:hypothetical protein